MHASTTMLMRLPTITDPVHVNLSSEDPIYDEAGPSYDSNTLFEIQDHDTFIDHMDEYHEVHEMQSDVQHNYIVDSNADIRLSSNIILNDQSIQRVNTSTEASGSKPRSNTKKNRILPAKRMGYRNLQQENSSINGNNSQPHSIECISTDGPVIISSGPRAYHDDPLTLQFRLRPIASGPTIEDTSITQADLHPSVNPVTGEPSSAQSTSGDVSLAEPNQVNQRKLCTLRWDVGQGEMYLG
ncbi:hypothetical protein Tco_1201545 [Tanacetum coccineum]